MKQTTLRAQWADRRTFHVYYIGLVIEYLGQVSLCSGQLVTNYITLGVGLHRVRASPTLFFGFRKYTQMA